MNDELQKKVLNYLDVLEAGAKKAGEFAETEVPQTIREWLTWLAVERFSYAAAFLVASSTVFFVGLWAGRKLYTSYVETRSRRLAENKSYSTGEEDYCWNAAVFCRVAQAISLIPLVFGTGYWTMQGTKVLVAPRVVLIEEVVKLTGLAKPK